MSDERPFTNRDEPGRRDVEGVEWWACDPYPTWYRFENGVFRTDPAEWADDGELTGLVAQMMAVFYAAAFDLHDVRPSDAERRGMTAVLRFVRTGKLPRPADPL